MKLSRTKMITGCCALLLVGLLVSPATSYSFEFEIEIDVSPNVLNIQSVGTVVTVHTDIAYSSVVAELVELNGLPIQRSKADNRGNFVAKFSMDDVKEIADDLDLPAYYTFELTGSVLTDIDGDGELDSFWGTQKILIIDVTPVAR